jgi:tetratricopeptide (TPR) repeat protein
MTWKKILNARRTRPRELLIVALLALAGLGVGTVATSYLQSSHAAPTSDTYDVETARDVTPTNTTDTFIATMQARLKKNPGDWQAYEYLGIAFLQKARETGDPGYYAKAEGLLNRALALNPQDFGAMSALGSLALSRHQFRDALQWGERARALSDFNPHNYGVIGDAQIELGMYDQAVQTFQTMVNQRPDLSSYSRVSYARELYGDLDGAIQAMQQAVTAGGPNAENTNWSRVQLGNLYFNRGQLDKAEHEYLEALADYPGYVHATAGLARVRAAQGKYDEAIDLYNKAIEIIPLPQYVIELGDLYTVARRPTDATRAYELVQFEEQLYRTNGVDVDMELALFDADHGQNLTDVVAHARDAYARRPSIQAADVLAWSLYQTGNYAEARKYSEEALRLGTRDALKYYHAAMISYRLGDSAAALDYLNRVMELNPHFSIRYTDSARQLLDTLRTNQASAGN